MINGLLVVQADTCQRDVRSYPLGMPHTRKRRLLVPLPFTDLSGLDRTRPRFGGPSLRDNPNWNPFSVLTDGVPSRVAPAPEPCKHQVHFVWYGTGKPCAENTTTPNQIASRFPHAIVNFWCMSRMISEFAPRLHVRINKRSVEHLLETIESMDRPPVDVAKVRAILQFYLDNRVFAPAKDLITFLLLAVHGGYFFDANCRVENWGIFGRSLAPSKKRQFPAFISQASKVSYNPGRPSELDIMGLLIGIGHGSVADRFSETDMWAMYSPPGHPMFWTIVQSYVDRAEAFGIIGAAVAPDTDRWELQSMVKGSADQKRTTAGALGAFSIYTGMYFYERLNPAYKLERANWTVSKVVDRTVTTGVDKGLKLSAPAEYWVRELGLSKSHGNTWT